jgi:uncharacterized protein
MKTLRKAVWVAVGFAILTAIAGAILADNALHPYRAPISAEARQAARATAEENSATLQSVQARARDGTILKAWLFQPSHGNEDAVLLLHGHQDNRTGMTALAALFLRHQYLVLAPDLRAHGESGGDLGTFGLLESQDVSTWLDLLKQQTHARHLYALGESMGAAVLLQSLQRETRFAAVAAECPYASFREVAYDRMGQLFGTTDWLGRTLLRPLVESGFLYARLRYGIHLADVNPARSLAGTKVPILLIHGTIDHNVPPRHSAIIRATAPPNLVFWSVPDAGHTGAYARWPEEFEHRVVGWFERYNGV